MINIKEKLNGSFKWVISLAIPVVIIITGFAMAEVFPTRSEVTTTIEDCKKSNKEQIAEVMETFKEGVEELTVAQRVVIDNFHTLNTKIEVLKTEIEHEHDDLQEHKKLKMHPHVH